MLKQKTSKKQINIKTRIEDEKISFVNRPDYTKHEENYYKYLIDRLQNSRNMREDSHIEFDDKTYSRYFVDNMRTANAYNPPRVNESDVRINSGIVLEKKNTLLSTVLNYNLEPDIQAYNKNDLPILELGRTIENLVDKSRKIEHYEDKRPLYYQEGENQGTWFVEEIWLEEYELEKKLKDIDFSKGINPKESMWTEKINKKQGRCETKLLNGMQVYLGNIREFFIEKQPYVFTAEFIHYEEVKNIYGNWDRFQYVARDVVELTSIEDSNVNYRDWTTEELKKNMVLVIKYQDKPNNEIMIMLNGVMMLPIGFPLKTSYISPSGEYTFVKGDIEPINKFFAYSKSISAKNEMDQATFDSFLRAFVVKTQQSSKPPLINNSGKVLSRKILDSGNIEDNLIPNSIAPLMDFKGITQSEFNMLGLLREMINEKSVSPLLQGQSTPGQQTALEIKTLEKQQILNLGFSFLGFVRFERQLIELRIKNIVANWTQAIDINVNKTKGELEDIYRKITIESNNDEKKGRKIIEFMKKFEGDFTKERQYEESEKIRKEEEEKSDDFGEKVSIIKINAEILSTLSNNFYVNIVPTQKDSDALNKELYKQFLNYLYSLWPQDVNKEYVQKRIAVLHDEDPSKTYIKKDEQPEVSEQATQDASLMQQGLPQGATSKLGKELTSSMRSPSLKELTR